jgi:hypothetical protein
MSEKSVEPACYHPASEQFRDSASVLGGCFILHRHRASLAAGVSRDDC